MFFEAHMRKSSYFTMILGQLDAKMDPRWRQDDAKMALCWLMLALLGAILAHLGALGLHLVAELSQDGGKVDQDSAKVVPRGPRWCHTNILLFTENQQTRHSDK